MSPRALWLLLALLSGCAAPAYVAGRRTAPPDVEGVSHTEERVASTRGVTLLLQAWRPASGEVRGVVVVVHGLKDYSDRYAELAHALVAKGLAVHALDLRGHGDSTGPRVWVDSFDDYLADLDQLMERVAAEHPGMPLFLFGHSMGGAVATLYAIEHHPELSGLILSGAALRPEADAVTRGSAKLFGAVLPTLAVFTLDDAKFSRDPAVVAAMKRDPLIEDGAAPARTAAELIGAIERIRREAFQLTCPLVAMHGTADEITPPEGSRELVEAVASPDKAYEKWDGYAHDLLHEPGKQQIIDFIVNWVDAHLP